MSHLTTYSTLSGSWDSTSFFSRRMRNGRRTLCRRRMIRIVSSSFSSIYAYVHVHVRSTHLRTCMYTHQHTKTHIQCNMCRPYHTQTQINNIHVPTCTMFVNGMHTHTQHRECEHTHIHAHTHRHTHICIHAHTHRHTHILYVYMHTHTDTHTKHTFSPVMAKGALNHCSKVLQDLKMEGSRKFMSAHNSGKLF